MANSYGDTKRELLKIDKMNYNVLDEPKILVKGNIELLNKIINQLNYYNFGFTRAAMPKINSRKLLVPNMNIIGKNNCIYHTECVVVQFINEIKTISDSLINSMSVNNSPLMKVYIIDASNFKGKIEEFKKITP